MRRLLLALGAAAAVAGGAAAAELRLEFPVDCVPGRDCWLFQLFDHDAGPGWRDFACGKRSYDGHTGTDIALRDLAAIDAAVPVLAAASGTVRAVRDGMPDRVHDPKRQPELAGRDCGNGVVIAHGAGWETQYCHLRQGSVAVRPGQAVAAGERLGVVGISGRAAFPHVELIVRLDGVPIDPFTGAAPVAGCGVGAGHLWSEAALVKAAYSPVDILDIGVAPGEPKADDAHAGRLNAVRLSVDAPALVVWARLAAVRAGDRLSLSLTDPAGRPVVMHRDALTRDQIRYFAYAGRKRHPGPWPPGLYTARAVIERGSLHRKAEERIEIR